MAKIDNKIKNLRKMLNHLERSLNRLLNSSSDDIEFFQDSVASRFKILIESTWKLLKSVLEEKGFTDVPGSPKDVIFKAKEAKLIDEQEYNKLINCISLRNLASHLYDQPQYLLIVDIAPSAFRCIENIVNRMEKDVNKILPPKHQPNLAYHN